MLKISPEQIVFKGQKSRNLLLANELNDSVIYKIKTNNVEAIDAKPNCGIIEANKSLCLLIRSLKVIPFQAKLQIIYATVEKKQLSDNFNDQWAVLDKNQLKYFLVPISRVQDNTNIKSSIIERNSTPYQSLIRSQEKMVTQSISMKSIKNSRGQQQLPTQQIQKQIQTERNKSSKLRQQLQITQKKLKELNDHQLQMKINRSMGIVCQEHHTSFNTLILIGLFCLVLGFCIGKLG